MDRDPATTAFLAFRRTGAPQHLGRAFDLLAPELMLVATRLLPAGADSADLVQQTFLTALQQAARFDATRALAPWLCGILVLHVRRERRRRRRQIDPRRLPARVEPEPPQVAMTHELAEQVRQRVAALPQPYRQVLHLHLLHGLRPHEVALSLGLPFRTVQSQLRRGLGQLRRAPALAVVLTLDHHQALATVRAQVLAKASVLATAGWLALPWLRAAMLALLLVPGAFLAAAVVDASSAVAVPPKAIATATAALTTEVPAGPAESHPDRAVVQDPVTNCRVSLRLVRAEDGAPLVDATAALVLQQFDAGRRKVDETALPPAHTDAAGRVQFDVPRRPRQRLKVTLAATDRMGMVGDFDSPDRDAFEFAVVAVPRLASGRIRVRDQHGTPVAGLELRIGTTTVAGFTWDGAMSAPNRTDDAGWTERLAMPAGQLRAVLGRVPIEFARGDELELPFEVAADGDRELTLPRPDPKDTIAGRVLDERGEPIARAWVALLRASDGARVSADVRARVRTDAEGRFVLLPPAAEAGPFRLAGEFEQGVTQAGDASWQRGITDAVLTLRTPTGLRLQVVDAADGSPVEDFGVICLRVHEDQHRLITGERDLRLNGHHASGFVIVDKIEIGLNRLLVLPSEDDPHLPTGYLPIQVDRDDAKVTVRLHRPAPIAVWVTDPDGKAIAGSRVLLLANRTAATRHIVPLRSESYGSTHWLACLRLAEAITDEHGVAALPWQPWHEPVVVRAEGPGHVLRDLELPSVIPGGVPIELRVARGATVHGTVQHLHRWPALAVTAVGEPSTSGFERLRLRVVMRNAADGTLHEGADSKGFPIGADGTFVANDVPPGRWQLLFGWNQPYAVGATVKMLQQPLAEFVATAGQQCEVSFDLGTVLPGTLQGRVLLDGKPVAAQLLSYECFGVDHLGQPASNIGLACDRFALPGGGYRMAGIIPGSMQIEAWIDGRRYTLLERVELAPGDDRQLDLNFRQLVVRVRLLRADGATPLRDRVARIGGERYSVDADGWLTLDPVPSLRFDVELYGPGIDKLALHSLRFDDPRARTRVVGTITIDPQQARSEHRLTVADG